MGIQIISLYTHTILKIHDGHSEDASSFMHNCNDSVRTTWKSQPKSSQRDQSMPHDKETMLLSMMTHDQKGNQAG